MGWYALNDVAHVDFPQHPVQPRLRRHYWCPSSRLCVSTTPANVYELCLPTLCLLLVVVWTRSYAHYMPSMYPFYAYLCSMPRLCRSSTRSGQSYTSFPRPRNNIAFEGCHDCKLAGAQEVSDEVCDATVVALPNDGYWRRYRRRFEHG